MTDPTTILKSTGRFTLRTAKLSVRSYGGGGFPDNRPRDSGRFLLWSKPWDLGDGDLSLRCGDTGGQEFVDDGEEFFGGERRFKVDVRVGGAEQPGNVARDDDHGDLVLLCDANEETAFAPKTKIGDDELGCSRRSWQAASALVLA